MRGFPEQFVMGRDGVEEINYVLTADVSCSYYYSMHKYLNTMYYA